MIRPVLVTRAAPGSQATLARLRAAGYDAMAAPTARIEPWDAPPVVASAIALTSPHGAIRAGDLVADKATPTFTVGAATADAAREAGFIAVASANADGLALANLITQARPDGLIIHIRGRDQAFDLVDALTTRGFNAQSVVAYSAEPVRDLSVQAKGAVVAGAVVLVHSAKGAERFLKIVGSAGLADHLPKSRLVAISRQAAESALAAGFARIDIAAEPNEDSLIEALEAVRT